ncbi:hypothetical protein [Neolewinella agarilytica]|uniref:Uncharacterized protein n=1 Tax=Neolewinella agarilytica TaxID=478744 RepID=A0A1H9K252_9BACT|nr:hypothetical protein [Neolewinella agarilytica]SEQ93068.1 hypothetical protein SAMN05444359_11947 [Neolewinella agarilytica]
MSPSFLATCFALIVGLTIELFSRAAGKSDWRLWAGIFVYALIQFAVAATGFYENTEAIPPRFLLNVLPAIALIIWLFTSERGKAFLNSLDLKKLTWVHVVRVPVELVLYSLFLQGSIPEIMTFSGNNFDIVMGLTAPAIIYFGYGKGMISPTLIKIWHIVGLILLINIIATAVLSVPFSFQQFGFEQPNVAVLKAPYNLLPAVIVPLVIVAHLVGLSRKPANK